MNLADACERKTYADGQCIIKQVSLALSWITALVLVVLQGDIAEHFFLLEAGKVTVTREDPVSANISLSTHHPHHFILV